MRLAVVLALAACSSGPRFVRGPAGEPRPIVDTLAPAITFGPIAHPAAAFNEVAEPAPPNDVLDAVHASLAELARVRGRLTRDPRLDAVAAEIAEAVRHGAPATDGLVDFALREHGIVEAVGTTLVAHGTTADAIATDLAAHVGDALFFGNVHVGVGGVEPTIALVTYASAITVTGAPRQLDAGGHAELRLELDLTFHDIVVTVHRDDGTVATLVTKADDRGGYVTRFECGEHTGPQWLQIEATGDNHTTARTILPIYCATKPPETFATEPATNVATTDRERRLIALINRERTVLGLTPLAIDPRAREAARRHAERMAREGSIEHTLGHTTPASRLLEAGLLPPVALETTMHVESLTHAAELLLDEPHYRADVVDARVTRLGLAAAADRGGGFYLAIEYVRVVPPTDVAAIKNVIYGVLRQRSLRVTETAALDKAATWYADHLAIGWSDNTLRDMFFINFTLDSLYVRSVAAATFSTEDPDWVRAVGAARLAPDVGIAVVQSARDGAYAGRVFIVLVTGEPTKLH